MTRNDWINVVGAGIPVILLLVWMVLWALRAIFTAGQWFHDVAHPTVTVVKAPESDSEAFPVIEGRSIHGTPVYSDEAAGWVTAKAQRELARRARAPKEI